MLIITGIGLIFTCLLLFSAAFYLSWKEKWRPALFFLLTAGLLLRLNVSLDPELHKWDERYHALVAKNLSNHLLKPTLYENPILPYNFEDWTNNNVWLHKQPLPLWLISASISIFGNTELAVRTPSIIFSVISILLIYYLGSFFFNRKVGFLSAFLFSINGLVIELTGGRVATDHIDIAFMFFVLLAIVAIVFWRNNKSLLKTFFIGIIIGLAMLCKWLPGLFVIPVWLLMRIDFKSYAIEKRRLLFEFVVLFSAILLIFLPWQIYTYIAFPLEMKYETIYNFIHFSEGVENHTGSIFYFLDKIRINYGELIYLPLIWIIVTLYRKFDGDKMALLLWFGLPLLFFSLAKTKMQGYILFASGPLFILTAAFFYWLIENRSNKFRWLQILICVFLIALPIRYCIERVKPFEKHEPAWSLQLKRTDFNNGILFNYSRPVEAMFYTNVIAAYTQIPAEGILDSLHNKGYKIFINKANLPESFKVHPYVNLVEISE